MANPATTVTEYSSLIVKSQLLSENEIAAFISRWRAESGGSEADHDGLRKSLVAKKALTNYQAALLQRGHTEGFFISDYTILDRIGKGQSAGVYKARHKSGQIVALKILPASKTKEANTLNRFQREGRLLTQLNHPNVVHAFQVGREGNVAFIVMEYLDGETLSELFDRRIQLSVPEAVRLISQALAGLQHLHEKKMIHRDLKPANMMLTTKDDDTTLKATLKILDIGIGREKPDEDDPATRDIHLTSEGTILGTPDYLAPEQARDARNADIRSDVYSLGCVFFHMLAGRAPFEEMNVMAQMVKHATEKPAPLAKIAKNVPPGLQTVFDKMTAKKPDERFQTPADAAEALRPFLPSDGAEPMLSDLLPTYKEWLETESSVEMPAELKKMSGSSTSPILPPLAEVAAKTARTAKASVSMKPVEAATTDINVELVPWPPATPEVETRSLFDPDRRDFMMLSFGAGGVILAGSIGYGLARLLRTTPDAPAKE
jgi:eukaryotic-like serine/threonine-protein kinase